MVGGLFHFAHLAGTSLVPDAVFAHSVAQARVGAHGIRISPSTPDASGAVCGD